MKLMFYYILLTTFLFSCNEKKGENNSSKDSSKILEVKKTVYGNADRLKTIDKKIKETKLFLRKHVNYNGKIFFLVDMRIPSNNFRFFVIDLQSGIVLQKGLVAHGCNSKENEKGDMVFSNEINSLCTSLGKYLVGESYVGKFGKSYRLYGLEKTNCNAIKRAIVLHKYGSVPDVETLNPICRSLGCPMVSPLFFTKIENIIDASKKKILLSIYY
jgi:hypothetical protein